MSGGGDQVAVGAVRAEPRSNVDRIIAALSAFDERNAPLRASAVLARLDASPATGYALIRAMVQAGLLERVDHGVIRLGPRAQALAFAPFSEGYGARTAMVAAGAGRTGAPAPAHWDEQRIAFVTPAERGAGPWRFAFANASLSNPWRRALLRSLRYGARVNADSVAGLTIETADDDWRRQCDQVSAMLEDDPDVLLISAAPGEDGALSVLLQDAMARGVLVVAVDRRPREATAAHGLVSASNALIGRLSALWLAERIGGRGRVWMLSGVQGANPAIRRQSAALDQFGAFPEIRVEGVAHTGWTADGGARAVTDLLDDIGAPPDAVWCDSGLQGVGALEAFVARGLTPPPHSGGDLNRMYKLGIEHRTPCVAIDYPAAMGALAIETAIGVLRGRPTPRRVDAPVKVILPRGMETTSVKADDWAEKHVRWDQADDAVLSQGASLRSPRAEAAA